MMEMALRQYGIDNPDNISKSFDELKAKYVEERRAIADGDEQAIAELNEKYDTMFNVEDFQLDSNKLKTIRTRFKDFVGMFSNTEKHKMLSEKIDNKMFKPAEPESPSKETEEPEVEQRETRSWEGKNRTEEEITQMDVNEAEKENAQKDNKEVEITKAQLNELGDDYLKEDKKKDEDDLIL